MDTPAPFAHHAAQIGYYPNLAFSFYKHHHNFSVQEVIVPAALSYIITITLGYCLHFGLALPALLSFLLGGLIIAAGIQKSIDVTARIAAADDTPNPIQEVRRIA